MNPYPIVLRAAKEAVEAYQKGDGPHEELRLKVLDTDRFLVQESSGYHQLLKIFKKPEAPAPSTEAYLGHTRLVTTISSGGADST